MREDYWLVKGAVSKEVCDLLADYARQQAALRPNVKKGGDPLAQIHRRYGDPLFETLLQRLTPVVEQAVSKPLWPTLSFYYTYKKGNQLAKHQDRSSCEYVAGLCVGMDDNYHSSQGDWPLSLALKEKTVSVKQEVGDLLIFKGHETVHWRERFQGEWFVSAIFAYVDKKGSYGFQKYDQRKRLGLPHIGMFRWTWGCLKHRYFKP